MSKALQIIENSYLKPLLDKGMNLFEYTCGILYAGVENEYLRKSDMQPSKEYMIEMVNKMAEKNGSTFNRLNPMVSIFQPPIRIVASMNNSNTDNLNIMLIIEKEEMNG